ncbi:MAG TPA: hypothetical protein VFB00_08970 [Terriglobales bacterium]|nr:hypothetical protein [Terriglobales bacterium]
MKVFLAITATLAWIFGIALLLAPAKFYAPMGLVLTPMLATIAQAHGATLFGLGVINWRARSAEGRGLAAVLGGNLVVQVLSLLVVIRAMMLGAGAAVAPAILTHVVLGGLFLFFLLRFRRSVNG